MSQVSLNPAQARILRYLEDKTNFARVIRISARKIALHFNITDQYAGLILAKLEELDLIEILERGTGQRSNKYRVSKIKWHEILVKKAKKIRVPLFVSDESSLDSKNSLSDKNNQRTLLADKRSKVRRGSEVPDKRDMASREFKVPSKRTQQNLKTQKTVFPDPKTILFGQKDTPLYFSKGVTLPKSNLLAQSVAHAGADEHAPAHYKEDGRVSNIIGFIKREPPRTQPSKSMRSPFARFQKKKYDVDKWNAQDVVCYYALLSNHIHGSIPAIDWRRDVGAARNLLNYFCGDAANVKRLIQIGFACTPESRSPTTLSWFTQAWVINDARHKWDKDQLIDDYDDRFVLAV